jgi:hypothetical protein
MANTKGVDKAMAGCAPKRSAPTTDRLAAGKDKGVPTLDQRTRRDQQDSPARPDDEDR